MRQKIHLSNLLNDSINLFRTFSSINTDKGIFYLPIDATASYNTEPKNIVTITILVAITSFLRAFISINK